MAKHYIAVPVFLTLLICSTVFYQAHAEDDTLGSYGVAAAGRAGGHRNQRQLMIPFPRVGRSFSSLQVPGKRQRVKGIPLPRVGKRDNEEFDQDSGKQPVPYSGLEDTDSGENLLQPVFYYFPMSRQNDFRQRK